MIISKDPISTYKCLTQGEFLQLDQTQVYTLYHRGTNDVNGADSNDVAIAGPGGSVASPYLEGVGNGIFSKGMTMVASGIAGLYIVAQGGAPCLTIIYNGPVNKLLG